MRRLAVLPVLLLLLAGCGGPSDAGRAPLPAEWRGRDLSEPGWVNETLQKGETLALRYTWSSGTRVSWDWVVTAPVRQTDPMFTSFVHFQLIRTENDQCAKDSRGQADCVMVASDAQEGQQSATVPRSGTYEMSWLNEDSVPVTIAMHPPSGGARVVYAPGQGPGCLFGGFDGDCLRWPVPPPQST